MVDNVTGTEQARRDRRESDPGRQQDSAATIEGCTALAETLLRDAPDSWQATEPIATIGLMMAQPPASTDPPPATIQLRPWRGAEFQRGC